ncbi:hypothetical protein Hanom_Chr12g01171991 [Helianthus anomalus]
MFKNLPSTILVAPSSLKSTFFFASSPPSLTYQNPQNQRIQNASIKQPASFKKHPTDRKSSFKKNPSHHKKTHLITEGISLEHKSKQTPSNQRNQENPHLNVES